MNAQADHSKELAEAVSAAQSARTALKIVAGASKSFYGRETHGEPLELQSHRGILSYEPTELVLTARAGTPLTEIEAVLSERRQMLPFEPPHFAAGSTLGGAIATGLSGPRRPYTGAVRDFVLGVKLLNGKGEILSFGGQVMKNVAGYDVSRLMAGGLGTLGILLEGSVKVLPQPHAEATLTFEHNAHDAIEKMNALARQPLPLSGSCHIGSTLYVRLSGQDAGVALARERLGGESADGSELWQSIRDHSHGFFAGTEPLWRISVPPATPPIDLPGPWLHDWGGAQRWLRSGADPDVVRSAVEAVGGHATLFRGGDRRGDVFHPLPPDMMNLHRRLKAAFDPSGILNPGRMYAGL